MQRVNRGEPMAVKYWSSAGLILTTWCNAQCASCYLSCRPDRREDMTVNEGLRLWRQLDEASPHGCRIHLTGGEPFGRWDVLIDLCRRAADERLRPPQNVETNAFWATREAVVRERLIALDRAGVESFVVSADPYHQQFVPIANARLAVRVAEEIMGSDRVRARWADWLADGRDTGELDDAERFELFLRYAQDGRDRMNGRAAAALGPDLANKTVAQLADWSCREALLRNKQVHVGPGGWIVPGTCAGILIGRADERTSIAECWHRLADDHAARPILGALAEAGPVGLLPLAETEGFTPADHYAGKCHLCFAIRTHLSARGLGGDELGPAACYDTVAAT